MYQPSQTVVLKEAFPKLSDHQCRELRIYAELFELKNEWDRIDFTSVVPLDILSCIGSFLDNKSLTTYQIGNWVIRDSCDVLWREIGSALFGKVNVEGSMFISNSVTSWWERYLLFSQCMTIFPLTKVFIESGTRSVRTCVPVPHRVTCTIPTLFSVPLIPNSGLFIELFVSVKFSPDAVRSVVGLINSPLSDLSCDRGLSRQTWGLAYGPLTGVVSGGGKYFDDFTTFRARHGLRDYLSLAVSEPVCVRVGIFIESRRVAFYRLPETDYPDWECTGFIHTIPETISEVFPSVMFSSIGYSDSIEIKISNLSSTPPYTPHTNTRAAEPSNWNSFAEESAPTSPR